MKSEKLKKPDESFVTRLTEKLTEAYLEILNETDPASGQMIAKKLDLQKIEDKNQRMRDYLDFWASLDEDRHFLLAAHDARLNHLWRMARVIGTTEIVQAHNVLKPNTAESVDFVLRRFREEGVAAQQVQKFLDENAVAWFSLTGHPTNPATVAYTIAQTKMAAILIDPAARPEDLKNVLRVLRDTPIVGPNKTPIEEAEEILNTLDIIYDSAIAHKRLFETALEKHGYAAEGVRINTPLIQPCVWTLGDGDGNAMMTARVLEDGIALHRDRIATRYRENCSEIMAAAKKAETGSAVMAEITILERKLDAPVIDTELLARQAEDIAGKTDNTGIASRFFNLAYRMRCFGGGFGKIDLRHNAVDIMETVQALFEAGRIMDKKRFSGLSPDEQAIALAAWLEDDDVIQTLKMTSFPASETDEAPARILERLRVMGKNPDMCEKLIVAEAAHPVHMLAALLLLKISGNEIGNETSRIDLVTLSESVADLVSLGSTLEILFENKSFRQHVASRKRFVAMIAKSDTTRQDGRGEAEYAQYEAAVDIYRITDLMKRKYPELEPVFISIKNGGGHALQRGGGRVTEVAALHGRAAADARVTDIGPSTMTIQGQQQTILFCPGKTAIGTLEALAAHNLYTKAGIQGEMPAPVFSKNVNKQYARADARLYAKAAGKAFDRLAKTNPAIDELLVAAPWLSMKAGNASSRPAKRGEKPVGPGITPAEAKGIYPKALAGRAISGERLTAHACLPVFSVLGLLEAMETVRDKGAARMNPKKYGDALHHLYRAHKIHRDAARATINAVAMADFDIAWPLLTGRQRPSHKEVTRLAGKFIHAVEPFSNPPEVTLAFLEDYFLKVEKLTYEMISGQKAKSLMRHGDALKKLWPELAGNVERRNRGAEFSRTIECHRTTLFDAAPDVPLSKTAFRITQALYTAANVVSAPVGILATRTRLEPVQEIGDGSKTRFMRPQSYAEKKVAHLLKLPNVLK